MNNILALVRNVKIKCTFDSSEVLDCAAIRKALKILRSALHASFSESDAFVYKKSVDARDRGDILLVYTVAVSVPEEMLSKKVRGVDFLVMQNYDEMFLHSKKTESSPVVVGFGPSGMFCALVLAKAGLCPVVIERGADVDERAKKVDSYWKDGILDTETNVQFGEGGAGTFSDGKLLTRISDRLSGYVLSELVRHGAPKEIAYLAKPHIGTDNLRNVVKNIRKEIISLGGKVLFNTKLESICADASGRVTSVVLGNDEELKCDSLFLCIGHSARDTVKNLMSNNVSVLPKPFSVGVRIEHLQSDINAALYGDFAGAECLGAAQYTLSRKYGTRAVYSFCMCPGGTVVASASDKNQIVTNGMSYYARDGKNANSAIAVSVDTEDFGNTVEGAIRFQEDIEKRAYAVAGGDGTAPIQLLSDFFEGKAESAPDKIIPTYTGRVAVRNADDVFPKFITDGLRRGISDFDRDIKGFSCGSAVLTFPETRTSSPVRIPRNDKFLADGFLNLYPCGEGAGYAGGITSAAVDGIKAAICYLNN
ncbi:MAG: hypothetical protein IJZ20_08195 [Clostridia bacterium]|nr:hypothetical protein [Clostridia bacterium]